MEECKDPKEPSFTDAQNVKKNTRKNEKICNVKDPFPPIEVPMESIHIIESVNDWETVAEDFLETVDKIKVCLFAMLLHAQKF